ncbi:MAG TPA: PEP-CTERM sorting domain-containing protein [Myxococcota bacterium]|jgi:hypothetical protein|nr:PEP-CTERM sorting domain-containing protein [Myxococcota bacterium]
MLLSKAKLPLLALAVALFATQSAHAFTIQELTNGTTPSFSVGSITFSDFSASALGSLNPDLSQYQLTVNGTDLVVTGPFTTSGTGGQFLLSYTATSTQPITDVSAAIEGSVGSGYAALGEDWNKSAGGKFATTRLQLDPGDTSASAAFSHNPGQSELLIQKELTLVGETSVRSFTQGFTAVPEPTSVALVGGGLLGLFLKGRRKA